MPRDVQEQLTKYLADAHSIEEQALAQLRAAPGLAADPTLARDYEQHLIETEGHERLTRELLEARDAAPSTVKDVVMKAGGKGFLLFARLNPDTPGKLHAHSFSYEGLELASYELLRRVAERAGDERVASTARRIADEERGMLERLGGTFDLAVEAALRAHPDDDLDELLRAYLADAHAIEEQAIELLERAPKIVAQGSLAQVFEEHLSETREHAELVRGRLQELGGDPSGLKDAALRLGALEWTAFFRGQPDTPGKLAAFAFAFEHLEIAAYELLKRVAARVDDAATVSLVEAILVQEHGAADRIAALWDEAVDASLAVQDVSRA